MRTRIIVLATLVLSTEALAQSPAALCVSTRSLSMVRRL